jgi:hypothetical protein
VTTFANFGMNVSTSMVTAYVMIYRPVAAISASLTLAIATTSCR